MDIKAIFGRGKSTVREMVKALLELERKRVECEAQLEGVEARLGETAVAEALGRKGKESFEDLRAEHDHLKAKIAGFRSGEAALRESIKNQHGEDIHEQLSDLDKETDGINAQRERSIKKLLEAQALVVVLQGMIGENTDFRTAGPEYQQFYQNELNKAAALFPAPRHSISLRFEQIGLKRGSLRKELSMLDEAANALIEQIRSEEQSEGDAAQIKLAGKG